MQRLILVATVVSAALIIGRNPAPAAILSTSTMDSADLDFDGGGTETDGDLSPLTAKTFVLTGGDIPGDAEFADITSITINFSGSSGTTLSAKTGFQAGIGLTYPGETGEAGAAVRGLTPGATPTEVMSISIASTSTTPDKQVLISGVDFTNWRNAFPFPQATFTGVTVGGGSSTFTGVDNGPSGVSFDDPANSFTVQSTVIPGGGDSFRLESLTLTTASIVPEPSTFVLIGFGLLSLGCMILRRERRRISTSLAAIVLSLFTIAVAQPACAGVIIDDFTTAQTRLGTGFSIVSGGGILGTEREVSISGLNSATASFVATGGLANLTGPTGSATPAVALFTLRYDGTDGSPGISYNLGGVDLTDGGLADQFVLDIASVVVTSVGVPNQVEVNIAVGESTGNAHYINSVPVTSSGLLVVPFSSLATLGAGADFTSAKLIDISVRTDRFESIGIRSVATSSSVPEPSAFALAVLGLFSLTKIVGRRRCR